MMTVMMIITKRKTTEGTTNSEQDSDTVELSGFAVFSYFASQLIYHRLPAHACGGRFINPKKRKVLYFCYYTKLPNRCSYFYVLESVVQCSAVMFVKTPIIEPRHSG